MTMTYNEVIDKYYPPQRRVRDILIEHSRCVADMALKIAHRKHLPLADSEIETAAMLHDIGIIATDAPGIDCHGSLPYLAHGAAGADMLRREGVEEKYALVAERHTGAGLTPEEIKQGGLPLPSGRSYMPQSLLEKLICYADCFYSKGGDMKRKDIARVRASMARFGPGVALRFEELHNMFSDDKKITW